MFEKEYTVRYSEVDYTANASLSSIMSYLQDTTMMHSDSLGQGVKDLADQELAWLLSTWHIKISRFPVYRETISARTWATKFSGLYGYRDFEIVDKDGSRLVAASSAWFLYNAKEQKIQRISKELADIYCPEENFVFGENEPKIHKPEKYTDVYKRTVTKRDLDTNNHVNNVHYVDFVTDALPADKQMTEIRISYKKAAVLGDVIHVATNDENGIFTCVLHDGNDGIYAILQFN